MTMAAGHEALRRLESFCTYSLDVGYDEMFDVSGVPRPQYAEMFERLQEFDSQELGRRQSAGSPSG